MIPAAILADRRAMQQAGALPMQPVVRRAGTPTPEAERLAGAVLGLWAARPDLSARDGIARWQSVVLSLLTGGVAGLAVAASETVLFLLSVVLALPFFCVVVLRTLAIIELTRERRGLEPDLPQSEDRLPVYSVLVPLFDEAAVLPRLIKALGALDYPDSRLDIHLIVESVDDETRRHLASIRLPAHFRTVVVPDCQPRTKPKALNYALGLARGSLVVIYDAEDVPEPDQLRRAAAAFARAGPELACLQARLHIDRPATGFLARQFALEYAALFDGLLPALERYGLPVPLGGTSNHFRVDILRRAGAWDAFNMTEDADLGIRLARLGCRVATLESTTYEESPPDFGNWFRQRTRWLKGWMQTYLVHTRRPRQLAHDLGPRAHAGVHVLMGGILLSVLAYPVSLALLAQGLWDGRLFAEPVSGLEGWLWWVSLINLGLGLTSSMALAALAVHRRGRRRLMPWALGMPVYWLLISAAGYRALWKLMSEPFRWEKTRHGDDEP
jgi:cellulose synthase/poly-beta-1,6-N-acetylglucosamine synthase-like glycosyltransferase